MKENNKMINQKHCKRSSYSSFVFNFALALLYLFEILQGASNEIRRYICIYGFNDSKLYSWTCRNCNKNKLSKALNLKGNLHSFKRYARFYVCSISSF